MPVRLLLRCMLFPLPLPQISGLYIILGTSLGLGLLGAIYSVWWHHVREARKAKKKEQAKWAQASEQVRHFAVVGWGAEG